MLGVVMSAVDIELRLLDTTPSEVLRNAVARRIIAAAKNGETNPATIKRLALFGLENELACFDSLQTSRSPAVAPPSLSQRTTVLDHKGRFGRHLMIE
jgi:hypothetical protein